MSYTKIGCSRIRISQKILLVLFIIYKCGLVSKRTQLNQNESAMFTSGSRSRNGVFAHNNNCESEGKIEVKHTGKYDPNKQLWKTINGNLKIWVFEGPSPENILFVKLWFFKKLVLY